MGLSRAPFFYLPIAPGLPPMALSGLLFDRNVTEGQAALFSVSGYFQNISFCNGRAAHRMLSPPDAATHGALLSPRMIQPKDFS